MENNVTCQRIQPDPAESFRFRFVAIKLSKTMGKSCKFLKNPIRSCQKIPQDPSNLQEPQRKDPIKSCKDSLKFQNIGQQSLRIQEKSLRILKDPKNANASFRCDETPHTAKGSLKIPLQSVKQDNPNSGSILKSRNSHPSSTCWERSH